MNWLTKNDIFEIFKSIRDLMADKKDELIKIDNLGDGDLGLTMEKGFNKIC